MWKKLYDAAVAVQNSRVISPFIEAGGVAAAILTKKGNIYVALLSAMVIGRLVWGAARFVCTGLDVSAFGISAFWAGAVTTAIPGIIVQIVLIPLLVMALEKAGYNKE